MTEVGQGVAITPADDYTGAGVDVIETDEQLEQFLTSQGDQGEETGEGDGAGGDEGGEVTLTAEEQAAAAADAGAGTGTPDTRKPGKLGDAPKAPGTSDIAGDAAAGETVTFESGVHYLDDRFKLEMNLDQLPKDMDAETEAKTIGDIFARLQSGLGAKMAEYDDVRLILEDTEVKDFIAAKAEGKTLKDYAIQYSQTTEGLGNEALVREELRITMPGATDEDITTVVEGFKTSNTLDKTADAMRTARTERETIAADVKDKKDKDDLVIAERKRVDEVTVYGNYLKGIKTVFGVPLTDQMRNDAFTASTRLDETGETYLDKALQSDQGVLLATLGLLHLEALMGASTSTSKNRAKKNFADKLFATPEELQSSSGQGQQTQQSEEDDLAAINQM